MMKIYKFKDLTDQKRHFEFYQIVLCNTIWCAAPDSLKDKDENEFKFELCYNPSSSTAKFLSELYTKVKTTNCFQTPSSDSGHPESEGLKYIVNYLLSDPKRLENAIRPIFDKMIDNFRNDNGLACFSRTNEDEYLWDEYCGGGNGVCIEINIPDELIGVSYHLVQYVPEKIVPVDFFLEAYLFPDRLEEFRNYHFATKTKKFSQEQEIRLISNRQNINLPIDGYISEVTFGPNVPAHMLNQLQANIINHCKSHNIIIA